MLETYKAKFLAHLGRKIIIPPTSPDKYTSYQFETIGSLKSHGLNEDDITPVKKRFSELQKPECYMMQSEYKTQDFLNIDQFETANWKRKMPNDAAIFILSTLGAYMNSNGIALPPDGDEDVVFYPLQS